MRKFSNVKKFFLCGTLCYCSSIFEVINFRNFNTIFQAKSITGQQNIDTTQLKSDIFPRG